ncbi:MAG: 3-hydroxyisobutyrate dehydrogenase [Alphaproteobacteria bacterium]|nr:3-hydroxyisobutyrate dehydrogenase [Alphaproteobacteria bacterium]
MSVIGFIGLGNMGLPMATNLVKAGYEVQGVDPAPQALKAAQAVGVKACGSVGVAAAKADAIITMLPNGEIVLKVHEAIAEAAGPGAVLIDSSTIDVASARQASQMALAAGLLAVDAPVSGGVGGATAGTLTFMAGGSKEAFQKASPFLDIMGGKTVYCGEAGAGQAAKICNNMLLGISMIGACEAFALADKLGLSAEAAFNVISTSSGSCWSVNTYCPVPGVGPQSPADNGYEAGFAAGLMLKDLKLAQEAARSSRQATPLGHQAKEIYQQFVEAGGGEVDFSGIIRSLKSED